MEKEIAAFLKKQMELEKAAGKKEKVQVCIKPNSYMGREIQYQTALLHEILKELRQSRGSAKTAHDNQADHRKIEIKVLGKRTPTMIDPALVKDKLEKVIADAKKLMESWPDANLNIEFTEEA